MDNDGRLRCTSRSRVIARHSGVANYMNLIQTVSVNFQSDSSSFVYYYVSTPYYTDIFRNLSKNFT